MGIISYICLVSCVYIASLNAFKWNPFEADFNACDMTFMWRYPMYMDVGFQYGNQPYSLWLYGEGIYAQKFLRDKKVDGIPIVFVPGNAGSGKQARSLGSILQNKTDLRNTPFHFDVFTLDFNEQFSGLSSRLLLRQADYLEEAVKYIWSLYSVPPKGIMFVGHSMGGIVIREVIQRPTFDLNKVALILTFATPHLRPPIIVDSDMYNLWKNIETAWNDTRLAESHIRIVSISSGLKDDLISETLARSTNPTVYHYVTTGIDRVWVEADHKCIVWCNQLIRHTSRFLFNYAENLSTFHNNVDSIIKLFYSGVGKSLKAIEESKNGIKDYSVCPENEACTDQGVIGVTKNDERLLIAMGPGSNNQLITALSQNCSISTRYLNEAHYFSIIEANECNNELLLINTNVSRFWVVNASQNYLSSVYLQSSIFQAAEARRFTVNKGIRRMKLYFSDVTPTSVFVVSFNRKCNGGYYRVIFESDGIQRFDEYYSKEKDTKIVRILSHTGTNGTLTFLDSEKCTYEIKIEQDWKNTFKMAILEWIGVLPALIFLTMLYIVYATSVVENSVFVFLIANIFVLLCGSFLFRILPFIVFFMAITVAFLIYSISWRANVYISKQTASLSQPTLSSNLVGFFLSVLPLAFVHPFIPTLIAAIITSFQNRPTSVQSAPFKLLFVILLAIPGVIYCIEVFKHFGNWHHPADLFTLTAFFFISSSFFADYQHYRIIFLVFATAIPVIWSFDFNPGLLALDFQSAFLLIFYYWALKSN